jgi:hypothetical protein
MVWELTIAVLASLELAVHAAYLKHASDDYSIQQSYHIPSLLLTKQSQYLFLVAIKFFKQSYQYKLI